MYEEGQRILASLPEAHRAHFIREAERLGIPLPVAVAVLHQESTGRPNLTSPAGAYGYMQLMPGTAGDLGVDPSDPLQNITGGLTYLRQQLDRFGDLPTALAAYNAGPGAVERFGGIPPYEETQNYVRLVMGRVGEEMPVPAPEAPAQEREGIMGALQERVEGVREALAPTPEGEPEPGFFGRLDEGLGALFGAGDAGPRREGPDPESVERLRAALEAGEIGQDTYEQMYARLLLEEDDRRPGMGLLNISEFLQNSYQPPRFIGTSLPTSPLRGRSGSGTSAIQRLGVRPLA